MKETKRTLISVMNHKGFNQNYATLGNVRLTITDGDTFREHTIESTDDWVETDSNGCISAVEVFREPRPYTADFLLKNKKVEDVSNHDIIHIVKENIKYDTNDVIESLMDEFINRYAELQKEVFRYRSDSLRKYTPSDLFNAMQFAVYEVTGRNMRESFVDVLVEDFIKERESQDEKNN